MAVNGEKEAMNGEGYEEFYMGAFGGRVRKGGRCDYNVYKKTLLNGL